VLLLVAQDLCPYVQRCRVLLEETGTPYVTEYIRLDRKPQWFLDMSPSGTVPLMIHDDVVMDDSLAINEYIDSQWGERTVPEAPDAREQLNERLSPLSEATVLLWKACVAKSPKDREFELRRLEEALGRLSLSRAVPPEDESMDLFECALVPLGLRLRWMASVEAFPVFEMPSALDTWLDAALRRPSATNSILPHVPEKFDRWLRSNLHS
jgi:glutathione S-transferase